jgi:hypothetical protein
MNACNLWKDFVFFRSNSWIENQEEMHMKRFVMFRDILKPKRWYIHHKTKSHTGFMIQVIPEGGDRDDPKYNPSL